MSTGSPEAEHTSCGCAREFAALEPLCHIFAFNDGWALGFAVGYAAGRESVWPGIDAQAAAVVDGARRSVDVMAARQRRGWAS